MTTRRVSAALLLAVPFALVVALTHHLTRTVVTFHGTDEGIYHLPVVRSFAASWPAPHWSNYNSATGPLYHYLTAGWSRLVGGEVWKLRALDVAISWAAAVVFAKVLRTAGASLALALIGAATLVLSPYVFGVSFLVITDNLALLFTALFAAALQRIRVRPVAGTVGAAAALGLACLTRQPSAWLVVPMLTFGWTSRPTVRDVAERAAAAALALIPLGVLVLMWHGLLPPELRSTHEGGFSVRNVVFGLAVFGVFSVLLIPEAARQGRARLRMLAGAGCGVLLLLVVPLAARVEDDGWLWRIAAHLPDVARSNLLFFPLLAAAGAAVGMLSTTRPGRLALPSLAAFLLSLGANQTDFQKYSEPILLAGILLFIASQPHPSLRSEQAQKWLLVGTACAGAFYFVAKTRSVL